MPGFICEVRTQFSFVAFAQQLRAEMEAFRQKSHVITILLAVSLELGQNQVVWVGGVKMQVLNRPGYISASRVP